MYIEHLFDISTKQLSLLNDRCSRNQKILLSGIGLWTLYNVACNIKSRFQKPNSPPTIPYSLPIVGHTLYLMFNHAKFIDWCTKNYGDVYNLNLFGETMTITSGKAGEETLGADREDISIVEGLLVDIDHLDYCVDIDTLHDGDTVLSPITKIALDKSKTFSQLPTMKQGFDRACSDMLSKTSSTIIDNPAAFVRYLISYMSVPTLVGPEFEDNREIIRSFADCNGDCIRYVPFYILFPRFMHPLSKLFGRLGKQHTDIMEKYIEPVVRKYQNQQPNQGDNNNIVAVYSTYEDENRGFFSPRHVAHAMILVAFISLHTTTRTMNSAFFWLLARPDLYKKFMDEVESIFPNNAPITYEGLDKMEFLNDYLREILLHTVNTLGTRKKSVRPYTFYNGYQIPAGRSLHVSNRQMNFGIGSTRFGVDTFDPSMSARKPAENASRDYVSLGLGKHVCPGRYFAMQEIKVGLIELFRNYDIKVASGRKPTPFIDFFGISPRNCKEPLVFMPRVQQ